MRAQHRVGDASHLDHFRHIVNSNDVSAAQDARRHCRSRAIEPFCYGPAAQHAPDELLAGGADQQGKTQLRKFGQLRDQFVILRITFTETDARIKNNLRFGDACLHRHGDGSAQAGCYIFHYVSRERLLLHGAGLAVHVHQNHRELAASCDLRQPRIGAQGGNVIHDFRTRGDSGFGHFGAAGIDGNGDGQPPAQLFEHREDSSQLLRGRSAFRAGTRRFAADIEDVRTGGFHFDCAGHGGVDLMKKAAVGKAVRRDVEHTHHERVFAKHEGPRRQSQTETFSAKHFPVKHGLAIEPRFAEKTKSNAAEKLCLRMTTKSALQEKDPPLKNARVGHPQKNHKGHILSGKEFGGGNYGAEGT